MATTRHRSLVENGGEKAFVRDKGFAHTHNRNEKENPNIHGSKKKEFEHIELPAKLLDYSYYVMKSRDILPLDFIIIVISLRITQLRV